VVVGARDGALEGADMHSRIHLHVMHEQVGHISRLETRINGQSKLGIDLITEFSGYSLHEFFVKSSIDNPASFKEVGMNEEPRGSGQSDLA